MLVLVAMPLKHFAVLSEATRVAGLVHGLFFLVYCWAVLDDLLAVDRAKWWGARAMLWALVPWGTFWFLRTHKARR